MSGKGKRKNLHRHLVTGLMGSPLRQTAERPMCPLGRSPQVVPDSYRLKTLKTFPFHRLPSSSTTSWLSCPRQTWLGERTGTGELAWP